MDNALNINDRHKHSRIWIIVTAIVLVITVASVWYFMSTRKVEPIAVEEAVTLQTDVVENNTQDNTLSEIKGELSSDEVRELEQAVTELKDSLSAFGS